MREVRETSIDNYFAVGKAIRARAKTWVLPLFMELPEGVSATVEEILPKYRTRFGPIPRNEFAKFVSYLCDRGYLLEVPDPRVCRISKKRVISWMPQRGVVKPKPKVKEQVLFLKERVEYLEAKLNECGIVFNKHNNCDEQLELGV